MPVPITPLPDLINKAKTSQNGFGYDEFVKIASLPKRPSYLSVSLMFKRNPRTIKSWFERYDREVK